MASYKAGEPIIRVDDPKQRFYVPVSRVDELSGVDSQIVLRVASDAFPDEASAVDFANVVANALNSVPEEKKNISFVIRDQNGRFYKKERDEIYRKTYHTWTSNIRECSTFKSQRNAEAAANHYVDVESKLNYSFHVLEIVKIETTRRKGHPKVQVIVEVLPEKYESILG